MSSTNHVTLDSTMGSVLIGVILSAVFSGVTYTQTFYYFINYPKDRRLLKLMVACIVVFDTAHQALVSHAVYHYLITNFNNPAALNTVVWSGSLKFVFNCLVIFLVQCFYVMRIWHLSNSYLLASFTLLIVVTCAACGLAWVVLSLKTPTFQNLWRIVSFSISVYALASGADILIAATLIVILRKSNTGFKQTETMLNKLVLQIVNTGALTSVMAIALLIAVAVSPRTMIYLSFDFCVVHLYTISFLTMLNMRKHLNGKTRETPNVPAIPVYQRSSSTHSERSVPPYASIQIGVHTTQEWVGQKAGYNQDHVEDYAGLEAGKLDASTLYAPAAPHPALTS